MIFFLRRERDVREMLWSLLISGIFYIILTFWLAYNRYLKWDTVLLAFMVLIVMLYQLTRILRRKVIISEDKIVVFSDLRPTCILPFGEVISVSLTREAPQKKVPLLRRYGKAHRSGADSLILTCKDGKRFRLAVEYHQKFYEEVMSRLK